MCRNVTPDTRRETPVTTWRPPLQPFLRWRAGREPWTLFPWLVVFLSEDAVAFYQASLFSFFCLGLFVSLSPLHSPWLYCCRGLLFICSCFWLLLTCLEFCYAVVSILGLFSYPCFSFLLTVPFIISALKSCFLNWPDFLCPLELLWSSLFVP